MVSVIASLKTRKSQGSGKLTTFNVCLPHEYTSQWCLSNPADRHYTSISALAKNINLTNIYHKLCQNFNSEENQMNTKAIFFINSLQNQTRTRIWNWILAVIVGMVMPERTTIMIGTPRYEKKQNHQISLLMQSLSLWFFELVVVAISVLI